MSYLQWVSCGTFRYGDLDDFCSAAKLRSIQEALVSGQFELCSEFGEEPDSRKFNSIIIHCKLQNGEI